MLCVIVHAIACDVGSKEGEVHRLFDQNRSKCTEASLPGAPQYKKLFAHRVSWANYELSRMARRNDELTVREQAARPMQRLQIDSRLMKRFGFAEVPDLNALLWGQDAHLMQDQPIAIFHNCYCLPSGWIVRKDTCLGIRNGGCPRQQMFAAPPPKTHPGMLGP